FVSPADGNYQILVTSNSSSLRAGPESYYLVRIVPERPDFELFLLPPDASRQDSLCLRQGGNEYCSILVTRRDGFDGTIHLSADGLPEGVVCRPQCVGPNLRQTNLVLSATLDAPIWTGAIHI